VARFRHSEVLILVYFAYVAAIAPFFIASPWRALALGLGIAGAVFAVSQRDNVVRDWLPLLATLVAYREMDWFTGPKRGSLERAWIGWDRWLLDTAGLRAAIESTGAILPGYLELCYLLVYAVAPVALAILFLNDCRAHLDRLWLAYLAATLGCYALFPYFPSDPPRIVWPNQDLPSVTTLMRSVNLAIVGGYGIHSSVFPSAHVASAFGAAWGLLATLERRRWIGWGMAFYGLSVAIATVYGRYHYAADAGAGMVMSLLGLAAVIQTPRRVPRA